MTFSKLTKTRWFLACLALSASACGGGSSSEAGGGGGSSTAAPSPPDALPFAVDTYFAASGYMRDARAGNALMTPLSAGGDSTCSGQRAPVDAPRGACHVVVFNTFGTMPELSWGGLYWQYPGNNWGEIAGLPVPAGATKITFQARGEVGGEVVGFFAGGIGATEAKAYADGFTIENVDSTLTTDWKAYELPIPPGADYSAGVIGGFGWGVGLTGNALPVKFYVDDIVWQ